jgi:transcription elongation factor Elf1
VDCRITFRRNATNKKMEDEKFYCPQCNEEMIKGFFNGKRMIVRTLKCVSCAFTIMYRNPEDHKVPENKQN